MSRDRIVAFDTQEAFLRAPASRADLAAGPYDAGAPAAGHVADFRRELRLLHDPRSDRERGNGRGLSRPRSPAGPRGGPENPARGRTRRSGADAPVRARGPRCLRPE